MKHIIHSFSNIPFAIEYHIGKNSRENTHILNLADRNDLWFHAKNYPSCHVIAHIPRTIKLTKKQRMTIIKMGCMLCKINTHSLINYHKIGINYTEIKNIEKSEIDGTVHPHNLKIYNV